MGADKRRGMDRCDEPCPDRPGRFCYLGAHHRIKHRALVGICEHRWTHTAEWRTGDKTSTLRATEYVR